MKIYSMKIYSIIRDIIFFILWLAILRVGIYTAKMANVIDSNLIYVNRKVPPIDKGQKPDQVHPERNFGDESNRMVDIDWYNE